MVERLAERLVAWQIRNKYLTSQDQKLYQYAFELLIGQVVNLLIACLLAVVFQAYGTVLVFLLSFIPLRSYAGGHHADNFNTCTLISTGILCSVCAAAKWIPNEAVFGTNLVCSIVCGGVIFFLAPIEDHNKPLSRRERKIYGRLAKGIWAAEALVWMICYQMHRERMSLVIALGHLVLFFLLAAGMIKNRKYKNRQYKRQAEDI